MLFFGFPSDFRLVDCGEGISEEEEDEDGDDKDGGDSSRHGLVVLVLPVPQKLSEGEEVEYFYELGYAALALHLWCNLSENY